MSRFFGGLMIAAGILIAGLSGLCTIAFLVMMLGSPGGGLSAFTILPLLVGGAPFAIGVALVLGGRVMIRNANERDRWGGDEPIEREPAQVTRDAPPPPPLQQD